ncbi:flagellar filament capping protein FliD [Spirochaetia bacterium 38H-sp]|uniref:Flagellar hook-associated protein 2 n=1 Tax=Rarispira pelagica TaxID=3141764 RepID=A0ABU9UD11_9SPIR
MSDISIPGVSSKYKTDELISKLVEAEKIPLTRLEDTKKTYESQKEAWRELSVLTSKVRESAKTLYSFENPFQEKKATSSDESILTATATREAEKGSYSIKVKKIATADRFLSDSIDKDSEIPKGNYVFKVGEEEIKFSFSGGKIKDFVDRINSRGKDLVRASLIQQTPDSLVLLIESKKTGKSNKLLFDGDAKKLAVDLGIIKPVPNNSYNFDAKADNIQAWESKLSDTAYQIAENSLIINPQTELKLPINPSINITDSMVMELTINIEEIPEDNNTPSPPPGPDLPETEGVTLDDVTVEGAPADIPLPSWTPPPPPPRVDDNQIFFLLRNNKATPLPAITKGPFPKKITISLSEYMSSIDGIGIRNKNTHKKIEVSDIRIYDPAVRGDYVAKNPISSADDAEIILDGIRMIRESNTIDDAIPGTTLDLIDASDKTVKLKIEPDKEAIKDAIISFVGSYNRLMADLNILTQDNEDIIAELTYFSDDEKDKAKENLGMFRGDSTLTQLKSKLQDIMINPYPTRDNTLKLLVQLGISSNASKPGTGGYDRTKLRGYLEINEEKLDQALTGDILAIKDMFGNDTDGDLVVDNGIAFKTEELLKAHASTGGIYDIRIKTLDTRIARTEKDIEDYKEHLEDYEASLKRKYGMMEGALGALEKNSKAIDNFSNSLNNK